MALRSYVKTGIVVGGFNPIDFGNLQKHDLAGALDCQPFHFLGLILGLQNPLFGPGERPVKAGIVKRLQQIVQRTRLECAQGVLIIGRHEDDCRRQIISQ